MAYPDPFVPRALTWEVPGRILADGTALEPLDEAALIRSLDEMRRAGIEAVAVCLLWSIVNPAHELRVAELIQAHLPACRSHCRTSSTRFRENSVEPRPAASMLP